MAEISLRQYLKTVEQHVQNGRYEEAIAHSRRILEHFPRLAAAYRLLGLALVGLTRWDEAGEVFRRLLSATPDDFIAHQQLSLIYEKLKQSPESLWHLERALDLQPNDQQSVARLRELYTKERGMPLERVPMTTAALANQYLNNGLSDQAIEVLQQAVQRMPERIDLKLMLARAQWQSGQHIEAGETAVEVLQILPYTLAANRIMTELWLEVERPADAQRFLSRVEEVDPYLALRVAMGSNPASEVLLVPELDYQQHVRRALTQQSPDWLENLAQQEEQPLDLSSELGDDWMNDIDPATDAPRRVTDNLPNLLEEDLSDTGQLSGLSPELIARLDAMRGMAADSTAIAALPDLTPKQKAQPNRPGMLESLNFEDIQPTMEEEALEADDSWLEELSRNDDFTIEASDMATTDDDWIGNLERAAGTTGDRVPTGLTGQLGEFDADDSIDDLEAMLNSLESEESGPSGQPRISTGLTGMLDDMEQGDERPYVLPDDAAPTLLRAPTGLSGMLDTLGADNNTLPQRPEPRSSTKPGDTGTLDVDTDNLAWVTEFDPDLATGNTSPLNPHNVPASDSADSLAWLQNSGIEVDEEAPERPYNVSLKENFEDDETMGSNIANPNAWMDAMGMEYDRTDDLIADGDLPTDGEEDSMAWAKGLDLVSNVPTSALPVSDLPPIPAPKYEADPLDWMSDDSLLAEYDAFEDLQENDPLDESDSDDTFDPDAFNAAAWEDETVGEGYTDPFEADADTDEEEDEDSFERPSDFEDDELTEDELVENADLYSELLDSVGAEDEDDSFISDQYRTNILAVSHTEGQAPMQTPSWQPSDPDDPDQPSMSDDLEWLSDDSLADDTLGEDTYIPNPDADEPITDLDSFFGGPLPTTENDPGLISEGDEAELADAAWLSDLGLDDEEASETPATGDTLEPEFDWSIEPATDVPAQPSWLSDLETSPTGASEADAGFDWNSGFGDEAALTSEEPDWLADIQDPMAVSEFEAEAEGTDVSMLPDEASWLADLDELELEDAADAPAEEAVAEISWEPESGFDLMPEGEIEDENEMGWLTQASDNVIVDDIGSLSTEEDLWNEDDIEAEPAGESWLAELDASAEDDAIAQPLSSTEAGWLDTTDDSGLDWEMLDDAEPSPTAGMTGMLNNIETQRYGTDLLDAIEPAEEEPTWLESVDDPDDVQTPEWMQDLEVPEESIAAGIDWSAATFEEEDALIEDDLLAPAVAETFDWENPAFAAENDVDQLAFDELNEDELMYDEDAAFDPDSLSEEAVLDGAEAEWLGVGQTSDEAWMSAEEDPADEPAWLSDLVDEDAEASPLDAPLVEWTSEVDSDDEFAYEQDDNLFGQTDEDAVPDQENDESLLPVGETGYFTGTADENFDYTGDDQNWLASEDDVTGDEFAPETEDIDWSAETVDDPVVIEGLEAAPAGFYSQANLSDADAVRDDVTDDDLRDYDFEEEIEATPAQNAPDWLNSMVPGLDLDFEAEEEAEEAVPVAAVPASPTRRKEFDWLETIVTEETQQRAVPVAPPPPPSLPGVPTAPAAQGMGERMRRFIFNDVPSWMRGTPAATVKSDPVATYPAPADSEAAQVMADLDRDFNADMDDNLFDDMDAEFDEFDDDRKN